MAFSNRVGIGFHQHRVLIHGACASLLITALVFAAPAAQGAEPSIPPVLLKMVRDPAIHKELKLSSSQIEDVLDATDKVDPQWWPSRILPPEKQLSILNTLTEQLRDDLSSVLGQSQQGRLHQLELQALGTRMLLREDVADTLEISEDIREKIKQIALETDETSRKLQQELMSGGDSTTINRKLEQRKKQERSEILGELNTPQKRKLSQLAGEQFDFSKVTRTLPRASELIAETEDWLQGGPHQLKRLRGKVVVVHFYAFQCINCRRNLPHYNSWFDDFSTDDVVIIGIQTPETSSERDPKRVHQAIKDEGIEYSVLFDGENKNWNAWGNTMWPTVYLIDKDGFIRTWWQGELNWQGTRGEQKIRKEIQNLIRE